MPFPLRCQKIKISFFISLSHGAAVPSRLPINHPGVHLYLEQRVLGQGIRKPQEIISLSTRWNSISSIAQASAFLEKVAPYITAGRHFSAASENFSEHYDYVVCTPGTNDHGAGQ